MNVCHISVCMSILLMYIRMYDAMYVCMYVCMYVRWQDQIDFFKTENIMMYECITQRYFLCLQIRIAFDKVFHLHLPSQLKKFLKQKSC